MNVTGTLTPDATCNYVQAGVYNGQDYARRLDGAWFIWWDGLSTWIISPGLNETEPPLWYRIAFDIEGTYLPMVPATGIATVAAGEH